MNRFIFLGVLLLTSIFNMANAALALNATRYVYESDRNSISFVVNNDSDKEYAAQVWIESDEQSQLTPDFIVTPTFFKIKGGGKQVLRIMHVGHEEELNKEKLYWLSLQEIPPRLEGSGISMAIKTLVKVFYRPSNIKKERVRAESNLETVKENGRLYLFNSTPFVFTIGDVYNGKGSTIRFSPEEKQTLTKFKPGDKIMVNARAVTAVSALNDYGKIETYKINE